MGIRDKVKASVGQVRDRGKRLVELNAELLKAELQQKAQKYGAAVGLFVGAALLGFFGLGLVLATVAAAIAVALPVWAALLIVTFLVFLLAVILAVVGVKLLKRVRTPAPEAAVQEARQSADAFKSGLRTALGRARSRTPQPAAASTDIGAPAPAAPAVTPLGGGAPPGSSEPVPPPPQPAAPVPPPETAKEDDDA
jgi:hypothetical protein